MELNRFTHERVQHGDDLVHWCPHDPLPGANRVPAVYIVRVLDN